MLEVKFKKGKLNNTSNMKYIHKEFINTLILHLLIKVKNLSFKIIIKV